MFVERSIDFLGDDVFDVAFQDVVFFLQCFDEFGEVVADDSVTDDDIYATIEQAGYEVGT